MHEAQYISKVYELLRKCRLLNCFEMGHRSYYDQSAACARGTMGRPSRHTAGTATCRGAGHAGARININGRRLRLPHLAEQAGDCLPLAGALPAIEHAIGYRPPVCGIRTCTSSPPTT
jgi:hypothetical protein